MIREALLGIAILPAVFMLVMLVLLLVLRFAPQLHNVTRNPLEDMLRTRGDAMIFAVVVMIAGGVREEIQRGFIVHRFGQYLGGALLGVAIYSVFFGLGHFEQGYDAMIATGLLGLAWGLLYVVAAQHRRADGQPRGVQPRPAPEVPGSGGQVGADAVATRSRPSRRSSSSPRCPP